MYMYIGNVYIGNVIMYIGLIHLLALYIFPLGGYDMN